jgi:hypothetical protein
MANRLLRIGEESDIFSSMNRINEKQAAFDAEYTVRDQAGVCRTVFCCYYNREKYFLETEWTNM